jgi:hypothetical protein
MPFHPRFQAHASTIYNVIIEANDGSLYGVSNDRIALTYIESWLALLM